MKEGIWRMKLLFVARTVFKEDNGLDQAVLAVVRQLYRRYEIDVAGVCTEECTCRSPLPEGVDSYVLLNGDKRIRQTLPAFVPMRRLLKEKKYDLIILEGNSCAAAVLPAARLCGTKVIYVDHAVLDARSKKNYFWWERRWESRVCEKIVTLTEESRQAYLRAFSLSPEKVAVIPNIVPRYDGALCTSDRTELVSVLRLAPEKGTEYIVKTAAALKKRVGTFLWRVWGAGVLEQAMRDEIDREGLENEVLLMGITNQKEDLYGTAGALVMTSRYEGWGLVLTEAHARGIPTFAFDVPYGPRSQIRDGVNGGLIEPFDCEKMADRLAGYLKSEPLRREMISHAREGLEAYYPESVRDQWIALLGKFAGEGN